MPETHGAAFAPVDPDRSARLLLAMQRAVAGHARQRVLRKIVRLCGERIVKLLNVLSDITAAMQRHHKETLKASLAARCVFGVSGGPENLEFECGDEPGWDQLLVLMQAATRVPARLLLNLRRSPALRPGRAGMPRPGRPANGRRCAGRLFGLATVAAGCHMPA